MTERKEQEQTEQEFLKTYNPDKYPKPSVTADILVFTISQNFNLELLLIRRGGHPFKGKWALPGGFIGMNETADEAAGRELQEETNLKHVYLEQLYTFTDVNRDPRMRVISIAYFALVPRKALQIAAGDDASDAKLFRLKQENWDIVLESEDGIRISLQDLAFDHKQIVEMGLRRLAGKVDYTNLVFELLADKNCFTIYEYQQIYDAIRGRSSDLSNTFKLFKKRYVNSGMVVPLDKTSREFSRREAKCYSWVQRKE